MEGTSKKCSRSQKYYSNTFKTKEVKKLYANRFKQRAVLAERGVTCADFSGEFADKRGLRGSEYSARRPCLKGHPISTEIPYLMSSDSAQCWSSSSSHSPTRKNPRRQTLLSRPRTRSSKPYFLRSSTQRYCMQQTSTLKVKKSLGRSASRDTSSHSAKSKEKQPMFDESSFKGKAKLGDGDISMGPSGNMPKEVQEIVEATKDLSSVDSYHYTLLSSTIHSTCTSARPMVVCMKLLNNEFDKISVDTYFKAIRSFYSQQQFRWDFIRMSDNHRRSWLSQLLP